MNKVDQALGWANKRLQYVDEELTPNQMEVLQYILKTVFIADLRKDEFLQKEEEQMESAEEASQRTGIDVKYIFETVFDGPKIYRCQHCKSYKLQMVHPGGFQPCNFHCKECEKQTLLASVIKEKI